jgi:hypothetical protein
MSDKLNDPTPVLLRFYLVRFTYEQETLKSLSAGDPEYPVPDQIEVVYLVSPDLGHYLCSPERMTLFHPVDVDVFWLEEQQDQEDFDQIDYEWESAYRDEEGGLYFSHSRVVQKWDNEKDPVWAKEYEQEKYLGEFYTYRDAIRHYENALP